MIMRYTFALLQKFRDVWLLCLVFHVLCQLKQGWLEVLMAAVNTSSVCLPANLTSQHDLSVGPDTARQDLTGQLLPEVSSLHRKHGQQVPEHSDGLDVQPATGNGARNIHSLLSRVPKSHSPDMLSGST